MNKLFFSATAAALLALLLLAPATWAQDATGKIAGNIKDATGAVISGATVTVTNLGTKISKQTVTDNRGFYQVLQLPIGNYEVSAQATGFSKAVTRPANTLEINQTLRVDMSLEVGAASASVTVEGQGGNVETENSTVGGTVTGEAIFELPLNGRNTLDLLATQPGVTVTNPDSGAAGNYSIGGGRTDSVTYLLDGGLNNDLIDNAVVVNPNPDAVAEFRVSGKHLRRRIRPQCRWHREHRDRRAGRTSYTAPFTTTCATRTSTRTTSSTTSKASPGRSCSATSTAALSAGPS